MSDTTCVGFNGSNPVSGVSHIFYKFISGLTPGDSITQISVGFGTNSSLSVKLGIYTDKTTGSLAHEPDALLAQGEISPLTTTAYEIRGVAVSTTVPSDGNVWVACIPNTNSLQIQAFQESGNSYLHSCYNTSSDGTYTSYSSQMIDPAPQGLAGSNNVHMCVTTGTPATSGTRLPPPPAFVSL